MRRSSIILVTLLVLASCVGKKGGNASQQKSPSEQQQQQSLTDAPAAEIDRTQVFMEFLYSISPLSLKDAQKKMAEFYNRFPGDTAMVNLVRLYLYDPNSPYRNEDFYLPYVSAVVESDLIPGELKASFEEEKRVCSMNKMGDQVKDFEFISTRGEKLHLFDINSEFTILFFSNPGCPACAEIINYLTQNPILIQAQVNGLLSVVNVYIDEDLEAWAEYCKEYPEYWYSGYDPNLILRNDSIYCIRAIPSVYLLDHLKRVVMKDAPIERVLNYLVPVLKEEII